MSWSRHGPPPGRRGYHHGNLREALIRATLDQRIMRGEEVLIEARVQVAFVSGGRARRIPEALRTAMRADQKPVS